MLFRSYFNSTKRYLHFLVNANKKSQSFFNSTFSVGFGLDLFYVYYSLLSFFFSLDVDHFVCVIPDIYTFMYAYREKCTLLLIKRYLLFYIVYFTSSTTFPLPPHHIHIHVFHVVLSFVLFNKRQTHFISLANIISRHTFVYIFHSISLSHFLH